MYRVLADRRLSIPPFPVRRVNGVQSEEHERPPP
jgi:hypothetical protein